MTAASILVIQGVDQGTQYQIGTDRIGIGRGVKNEIRILDTEVSRQHAAIHLDQECYYLADLDSSNGTFVNGKHIRQMELHDGDRIQIGRSVLLFRLATFQNSSKVASERVNLVSQNDLSVQSNIVSEINQESNRRLIDSDSSSRLRAGDNALSDFQVLSRIAEEAVRSGISQEQLLKRILDITIEAVGADRGCILIFDTETNKTQPQVFSHRHGADISDRMPVSRSIVDYVLREGQGVRTSDAQSDQRFEAGQSILQAGIREAMCVPMRGRYEFMGAIYVDTTKSPEIVLRQGSDLQHFSEEQLRLMVAIGHESGLAIENNRYQKALVKAERLAAVGQTIAMLSHHIKNILQGVRGGSYLIDMGLKQHDEDLIHKGWNIVEKNQNKIYHLVLDMLTYSKERQPALEMASLNETVSDVCELMQAHADELHVKMEVHLKTELPPTVFDSEGIHRAVLNIVTNAFDALEGREDGIIRIETGFIPESDVIYVSIADNGPGIPDEQCARIFNVFESTKGARGTGLGLAVSRKILREHGGDITIESEAGKGSRFVLAWTRLDEEHASFDEGNTIA